MALGGGTFLVQNKKLPGAYINFQSLARADATLSDRGIAAMPFELDWGEEGGVIEVTAEDFIKNSVKLFGYDYSHDKMRGFREVFKGARMLYAYRLGTSTKAACTYADARYGGIRGNDIKVVVAKNVDDNSKYDVKTYLGTQLVDTQTVAATSGLADNGFLVWKKSASLAVTAGTPLTGGENATVTTADYQTFLSAIESYSFNAIGIVSTTAAQNELITAFTKRLRDEHGVKFQCVVYNTAADHEGCVNVATAVTDDGESAAALCYWVTGIIAGCAVNKSNLNRVYDGEYTVDTNLTQTALEAAITGGKFVLHKVGKEVRVLADINSLVNVTDEKGADFKENQTVRVIDQIANDIAVLFNTKYLGVVPNDAAGRVSLWADVVKYHGDMQAIRAITDFDDEKVTVAEGDTKKAVVLTEQIKPVNAMGQLYMTVTIE